MDWWTIVGTVASVIGVGISIYLITVTQAARDAAQSAAQAASATARRRDLVEELEAASQKIQQVGNFIEQAEWVAVRLRTEEILAACKLTLSRWPDHLSEQAKNDVMNASRQMNSIANQIIQMAEVEVTLAQKRRLAGSQMRASGHISSALGEARKNEEMDGTAANGN